MVSVLRELTVITSVRWCEEEEVDRGEKEEEAEKRRVEKLFRLLLSFFLSFLS